MVKVDGLGGISQKISALKKKYADQAQVAYIVGFATHYAVYVHEDLDAAHEPGKFAKYLEGPARELNNSGEFSRIIKQAMQQGKGLQQGLLLCALRLLREAQLIVPVDTGALRASGYIREEQNLKGGAKIQ